MIHLVQLLCPERHAIAAMLYDPKTTSEADAGAQLQTAMMKLGINPWCGICGSKELRVEDRQTRFATVQAAEHGLGYDAREGT